MYVPFLSIVSVFRTFRVNNDNLLDTEIYPKSFKEIKRKRCKAIVWDLTCLYCFKLYLIVKSLKYVLKSENNIKQMIRVILLD